MAEYGSGIYYSKSNGSKLVNAPQLLGSNIAQVLCLPKSLDISVPILSPKLKVSMKKQLVNPKQLKQFYFPVECCHS